MTLPPRLLLLACLFGSASASLPAADLPPGVFVDVDETNTAAVGGSPSPFFAIDGSNPGEVSNPLWRRRTGFGFNTTGNRDVYEKCAGGAATPLVTTVTGLTPGQSYGVHVAFISVSSETWQVKAGVSAGELTLFTPGEPAGRVVDLGPSSEANSNRRQYLGFVGNVSADASGTLRVYSDDGNGNHWTTRSWLEGFLVGAPVVAPPPPALPGGAALIAPDGAWTWFNDERAIVHRGALYVGYVKAGGEYGVTRRDLSDGSSRHMILSTSASAQRDDHNNPSLTVLPDGRLLALYSKHIAGDQFYQRTSLVPDPASSSDWSEEIVRRTPAANTYANTYRLSAENNRVYNFHRSINFNPTLSISDDLGATWKPARQLISTGNGGTRPYTRFASDGVGRIDFIYTDGHPRDVANSLYHLYYEDDAFRRTNGLLIKDIADLPLNHDNRERGSVIYSYRSEPWGPGDGPDQWIPTGRAWTWDIHRDRDGKPVCVFQVQRDDVTGKGWNHDRIFYYYARWTGTEWQRRFIAHAGRPLYAAEDDYGGGMTLDPEDPRVVYISSNAADPFALSSMTSIPLRADERYEIWRGFTADGGLTFTWTQITENSAGDNLRPIVPENHGRTECLLWFHGDYRSYTSYNTRVLGLLGQPVGLASAQPERPLGAESAISPEVQAAVSPSVPSSASSPVGQPEAPPSREKPSSTSDSPAIRYPARR